MPAKSLQKILAPDIHMDALGETQKRIILALRFAIMLGKSGQCQIGKLSSILGGPARALGFMRLVHSFGAIWPDPIRIYRPCCTRIAPDEKLLLDLIDHAVLRQPQAIQKLLKEMLPMPAIQNLEAELMPFAAYFLAPMPKHCI